MIFSHSSTQFARKLTPSSGIVLTMKRGAERQITKDVPDDGDDDDDIQEIQDPQGFQKADESALARRQIRSLPKRALSAWKPPYLKGLPPALAPSVDTVEDPPQPKFGGFVGFGAGTSASSPFTFTAQPPPVSAFASSALDTAFKPTQLVSSSLGVPKLSRSDSDASPPKPTTSPLAEETDAMAFKYFKSLRGLNVSFLSAISTAVEKDPFFDVAGLVESYKNLRTTIQSEFDDSSEPAAIRASVTTNSTPLFGAKAPPEKTTSFTLPKPSGSAEASSKLPPTSESGTKTGGFTFPPFSPPSSSTPTQLVFGLSSKPSEPSTSSSLTPSEPPKPASTFIASSTSTPTSNLPPTSGFSLAAPSSIENTTSKLVPGSSTEETAGPPSSSLSQPASTTPSFGSSGVPNFFATAKSTNAFGTFDVASKPTSVFGSSIFGGGSGTTESSKPSPFNPTLDSKDSSKVTTTLFGNVTTTSTSTSTSIFGSGPDKPVSFFGSASPPKTGAFAFGKPGGSIGNPVGFGFGSASPSAGYTTTPGSSSSGFSFGGPSTKPSERLFSPTPTDKSSESTPQPEAEGNEEGGEEEGTKLLPSHTHDEEGEGEEDEETTYVVRCRIFRLFKSEDKSEWKDLGIGMFRLKKHKETNVRRVLMRNSNTGRILINFRIYGSLKPSLAKAFVSFIGYENSTPTSFRVRVKTEEQAEDLKRAMEREVAALQTAE
ncbi:hypothetical protein J3R82DRAFT_10677 [Butyriboletus roseoflavus]|nr:hypothetical protein J3R82DRAFT_10677 [Butyriboletus roseoflavus]